MRNKEKRGGVVSLLNHLLVSDILELPFLFKHTSTLQGQTSFHSIEQRKKEKM